MGWGVLVSSETRPVGASRERERGLGSACSSGVVLNNVKHASRELALSADLNREDFASLVLWAQIRLPTQTPLAPHFVRRSRRQKWVGADLNASLLSASRVCLRQIRRFRDQDRMITTSESPSRVERFGNSDDSTNHNRTRSRTVSE